ncbi:MAG: histidine kinase, partial [Aureispira sp.]|nr:histidine kinase [Aureispira sp.]
YKLEGLNEDWEQTNYLNNKIRYNALNSNKYTFWVKAVDNKGNVSNLIAYSFSIDLPYWKQWWFILFCFLAIMALVSSGFIMRIIIIKRENSLLLEKQKIEKELIESRQTALRSQMNPHFLFNALNSIQEMIMINDKRSASTYLGKFADLMRIYLNHSRKNKIKLREEIEALRLYLELEKVRFEDSLTISWNIDKNLDLDLSNIPSMLIQPYVENAFKHGLLHKKTDRKLFLQFSKEVSNDVIVCIIEDNGIGRAASAKLNKIRKSEHESFSNSATEKRLELLNYNKKQPIGVQIIDLKNPKGFATGTRVVLTIPCELL